MKLLTLVLRARFLDRAPSGVGIVSDNQRAVEQPLDQPWIRFAIRPGDSRPHTTGSNPLHRMIGRVEMSIFVPVGQGDELAQEIADQCEAIFRGWSWTVGDNRLGFDGFQRSVLPEENWFSIKVSALWWAIVRQ